MKKAIYFICYVIAILVGMCMLIFNHDANIADNKTLHYVFMGLGIIFILPGLFILLATLRPKRDENGAIIARSIPSTVTGIISMVWGVLLLVMPYGIFGSLNVSLGVSLIIVGVAQIIWIGKESSQNGSPFWLYIIPILTVAAGVGVLILKKDYQDPGAEMQTGCIISGITILLWGINGFLSLPRRIKTEKDIESDKKRLESDEAKVSKEESKKSKAIEESKEADSNKETSDPKQ